MAEGTTTTTTALARHLDAVLPGEYVVRAAGADSEEFRLRDDIDALLGFLGYRVQPLMAAASPSAEEAASMTIADMEARQHALERETLSACGAIFRHTYPTMTDEDVAAAIPLHTQRLELLFAFFTSRLRPSGAPPSATAAPSPAEQPAEPEAVEAEATGAKPSGRHLPASPSSLAATSRSKRSSRTS